MLNLNFSIFGSPLFSLRRLVSPFSPIAATLGLRVAGAHHMRYIPKKCLYFDVLLEYIHTDSQYQLLMVLIT